MARPALSLSRGFDIIEFLACFPDRAFTLSELASATKINSGTCHTLLAVLLKRGYLARGERGKTYKLGSALAAAGNASLKSDTLLARAQQAAETVASKLDLPVLLNTIHDDMLVCVTSIPDSLDNHRNIHPGQRRPLIPPMGDSLIAWASDAEIDAWIGRGSAQSKHSPEFLREKLASIRERGFHIGLSSPNNAALSEILSQLGAQRDVQDYQRRVQDVVQSAESTALLGPIVESEYYDILVMGVPIFDESGKAVYSLSIGGFRERVKGSVVEEYSQHLLRATVLAMHPNLALTLESRTRGKKSGRGAR